jgi:hypothetical protein
MRKPSSMATGPSIPTHPSDVTPSLRARRNTLISELAGLVTRETLGRDRIGATYVMSSRNKETGWRVGSEGAWLFDSEFWLRQPLKKLSYFSIEMEQCVRDGGRSSVIMEQRSASDWRTLQLSADHFGFRFDGRR